MNLTIYRDYPDGLVALGNLVRENGETTFCYNQEYLARTDAAAVSLSLPLREKPFSERATAALNTEGNLLSEQGFEPAPDIADELQEEMLPRLEVLSKI